MYIIDIIENNIDSIDGIIKLLSQLSNTENIKISEFKEFIVKKEKNHKIFLCKEFLSTKIVGIITLFIEKKIIHNMGKVAHIEDLVVDIHERNKGISKILINKCIEYAKKNNCYKIILNCKEELIKFYENNNFYKSAYQMRIDL
jgi:glucosamine-phosphate N-acetyltransferase